MRKLLFFAALTAIFALVAGCEKDKYNDGLDVGTRPIKPSAEVQAFFDENLESFVAQVLPGNGISEPHTEGCVLINSAVEFPTLPDIDFEKYTIVVGREMVAHPGYRLLTQGIDIESETMTLNLVVERPAGPSPTVVDELYYWGEYSKLPQKQIDAIIIN